MAVPSKHSRQRGHACIARPHSGTHTAATHPIRHLDALRCLAVGGRLLLIAAHGNLCLVFSDLRAARIPSVPVKLSFCCCCGPRSRNRAKGLQHAFALRTAASAKCQIPNAAHLLRVLVQLPLLRVFVALWRRLRASEVVRCRHCHLRRHRHIRGDGHPAAAAACCCLALVCRARRLFESLSRYVSVVCKARLKGCYTL